MAVGAAGAFAATPSQQGQSGYINMPSAWVEADGTLMTGYSYDGPYGSYWGSATVLPFLQLTGRYVSITGIRGITDKEGVYGSNYGRYKDKVMDAKVRLWSESEWMPSVAVGQTDAFGTELFRGTYVVASKSFGRLRNIEASIGYASRRPSGIFAGVRYGIPAAPHWALVAEYDANDYPRDYRAVDTEAGKRRKGPAVGVEYRWGWLGAQLARQREHFSANVYVSIPFSEREFIPKLYEPAPFDPKKAPAKVSAAEWQQNGSRGAALAQELVRQATACATSPPASAHPHAANWRSLTSTGTISRWGPSTSK